MSAKVALVDAAIRRPVEHRTPALKLADAIGCFFGVKLGHSPVIYILAASHRVGKMDLPVVAIVVVAHRRRHPALGHYSVSLAKQRLADQADRNTRSGRLDSGSQSGTAGTDDEYVVFKCWKLWHYVSISPILLVLLLSILFIF